MMPSEPKNVRIRETVIPAITTTTTMSTGSHAFLATLITTSVPRNGSVPCRAM